MEPVPTPGEHRQGPAPLSALAPTLVKGSERRVRKGSRRASHLHGRKLETLGEGVEKECPEKTATSRG